MSNRTNSDKAKVHARRAHCCSCGRVVFGNGGRWSHRQACQGSYLTQREFDKRFQLDPIQDTSSKAAGFRYVPRQDSQA